MLLMFIHISAGDKYVINIGLTEVNLFKISSIKFLRDVRHFLIKPNGMQTNSNNPKGVVIAIWEWRIVRLVLIDGRLLLSLILRRWYVAPCSVVMKSSRWEIGYWSATIM